MPSHTNNPTLTPIHTDDMFYHMKTTLNIDDGVMVRLRREAARTGRTMSELVETALRGLLQAKSTTVELQPLPSFTSGGALVDVADREALYRAMATSWSTPRTKVPPSTRVAARYSRAGGAGPARGSSRGAWSTSSCVSSRTPGSCASRGRWRPACSSSPPCSNHQVSPFSYPRAGTLLSWARSWPPSQDCLGTSSTTPRPRC